MTNDQGVGAFFLAVAASGLEMAEQGGDGQQQNHQ
jgi:hypothetical protein